MSGTLLIWLFALALVLASLAAIAVYAFRDFSRPKLRDLLRDRNQPERFDEILADHHRAALAAESLRVVSSAVSAAAAAGYAFSTFESGPQAVLAAGLVIAGIVVLWLAIIWLPTAVAHIWGERFLAVTWPVWRLTAKMLTPSIAAAKLVETLLVRLSGKPEQHLTEEELEDEIREVVTEGQREGLLEDDAREMIESVISLGEVAVSEIMTPRTDMVSMPLDVSWEEALEQITSSGHTRFPIYGNSRDEIVGILHIKDILPELARVAPVSRRPIADLLRSPLFVPETKPVNDMLQEFQLSRNHIAVVLDEFAGVKGLVTIEDVLEEIVGEIADEHDDAAADGIRPLNDSTWEALARVHISEINERLGTHLPEEEHYDTIGGLIFHRLTHIPRAGEEIALDGVKIRVLESTRRRINRVAIEVLPPAEEQEESAESGVQGAE